MSTPEVQRELGAHEARLAHLEEEVAELRKDMAQVLAILNQHKGSWKTLVAIGGLTAAVGSGVTWLVTYAMSSPFR